MPRRYDSSEVSIDRYDDRRDHVPRSSGRRVVEDRYYDEEIDIRSRGPPPRERDRETIIREKDVRVRERQDTRPAFLQEDYGRTSSGPMVLRAREREEFEFAPRRRSPSPEPERKLEREEIIIRKNSPERRREPLPLPSARDYEREEIIVRRDDRESRGPLPRDREYERDEVIIRRDERDSRLPPSRERDYDREEVIIRRSEREPERRPPPPEPARNELVIRREEKRDERGRRSRYESDYDETIIRMEDDLYDRRLPTPSEDRKEEIIIRRDERVDDRPRYRAPSPPRRDYEREEIIIRRDERDDDTRSRYSTRTRDDYAVRPKSHERERSRIGRSDGSEHNEEIVIRRDERGGRNGEREREEIIIRKHSRSRSRSPSPARSIRPGPPREPPAPIYAPPIHQEVITHHRHIEHGFENRALALRPVSRPPSPPMPPPPRERSRSEERIQIHRQGERNGRAYHEDIIIDRDDGARSAAPRPEYDRPLERIPPPVIYDSPARRGPQRDPRDDRDIQEEADYYNQRALERSYPGEGYHGATRDWAIVDVPPGTRRVKMDGAGGGAQEVTWQRYNGVRRSKFMPDGSDEGYGSEVGRPAPGFAPAAGGEIGRRYAPTRDPKEGLWTEITKDLVVKEAIIEAGHEFEETEDFYYIMSYMRYVRVMPILPSRRLTSPYSALFANTAVQEDVARLVGLSEDIKNRRQKRIREIEWERRMLPPAIEEPRRPLMIEEAPPKPGWAREEERYIERDVVYRGGRPPPLPGWR